MAMMFVHADSSRHELRALTQITNADIEINISPKAELVDNTWSVTVNEKTWAEHPIQEGHWVYIPGTEWGGVVTYLKHSTKNGTVTVQGPTFRGLLFQKRIIPPAGEGYMVLTDVDAHQAIRDALDDRFGNLVLVQDGDYGKDVNAAWRYESVAGGLHDVLREYQLRLQVVYDNVRGSVILSAQKVTDLTSVLEVSQDYGVDFTSVSGNLELANHCLALGQGELEERTVVNVYRIGTTYYLNRPLGMSENDVRTVLLDYPSAESEDELIKSARERLKQKAPEYSVSIDELSAEFAAELGDIIGVRDRLTGMTSQSEISRKILTITDGRIKIDAKVG